MTAAAQTTADARRDMGAFDLTLLPEALDEAYAFQDDYVAAVGEVAGYKMAVNGAPQMAHFGVSEPVCARVFKAQVHASGVALPRHSFSSLSVEPEITAILGEGVQDITAPVDQAGALALIDRFHASIELIDQRGFSVPQLKLPQAVALNVFNAGCVLGEAHIAPADLDLAAMHVTSHDDGALMGGATNNPPQHPVEAVMWLLNNLLARGIKAQPGMLVMCGTHLPLRTLEPDVKEVSIAMAGLGTVDFTLTD